MIGVMYAPKTTQQEPAPSPEKEERRDEGVGERQRSAGGERKMNVVRGGQSMFVRKDQVNVGSQVGWGQWIWNNVVGSVAGAISTGEKPREPQGGVVAGSAQSNIVVKALKGLSETVFGF